MKKLFYFLFLVLCVTIFSCSENDKMEIERSASVFDIKQAEASVKQSNLLFTKSYKSKDSVSVANCFTTDAQIMVADMPPIEGRKNIQSFISLMMNQGIETFKIKSKNLWGDSTILVEEGNYEFLDKSDQVIDQGKFIVLWKQESGNWKIYHDMWNSSLPPNPIQVEEKSRKKP